MRVSFRRCQPARRRRSATAISLAGHCREMVRIRGRRNPPEFGPCGTVLDLSEPLLFSHPERDFPYFGDATPQVEDFCLSPSMCVVEALGTIWVVSHDETKRFDAEDLRVMTSLSKFASAAYQTLLSANARETANDALLETVTTAQRFAFIVESSDDAIISKTLDGVITSWNGGAERIFGYSAEEALGQRITILIPPDRIDEETRIIESPARENACRPSILFDCGKTVSRFTCPSRYLR